MFIKSLKEKYKNFQTVYCYTPFDIARSRLAARCEIKGEELSKKEAKGYDYNLMIYQKLEKLKNETFLVGENIINIDTNKYDAEKSLLQLTKKLLG